MKKINFLIIPIILLFITGCSSLYKIKEVKNSESGMLVGCIDLSEMKRKLTFVQVYSAEGLTERNFNQLKITYYVKNIHVYDNGLFVCENLKPGDYFIYSFSSNKSEIFDMPGSNINDTPVFSVRPGQVKFIGSYKCELEKRIGFFSHKGEFSIVLSDKPTEKELLQQLLPYTKGTGWEEKISTRLNNL